MVQVQVQVHLADHSKGENSVAKTLEGRATRCCGSSRHPGSSITMSGARGHATCQVSHFYMTCYHVVSDRSPCMDRIGEY